MKLPIDSIKLDSDLQPRAALNQGTITEYAEAMKEGAQFPGVVVFHEGETYWLADGYHRHAAAKMAGVQDISAEIRTGSKEDALKFALSANTTHGLRRSQADKRRAVIIALRRFGDISNRELGRMTAVDDKTVAKYRERLETAKEVVKRLEAGESFSAILENDEKKKLFIFRFPKRHNGRVFIRQVYVDLSGDPPFYQWDTRGLSLDCLDLGISIDKNSDQYADLAEFTAWKGMDEDIARDLFNRFVNTLELTDSCGNKLKLDA